MLVIKISEAEAKTAGINTVAQAKEKIMANAITTPVTVIEPAKTEAVAVVAPKVEAPATVEAPKAEAIVADPVAKIEAKEDFAGFVARIEALEAALKNKDVEVAAKTAAIDTTVAAQVASTVASLGVAPVAVITEPVKAEAKTEADLWKQYETVKAEKGDVAATEFYRQNIKGK